MICLYQQKGLDFSELISGVLQKEFKEPILCAGEFKAPRHCFNPLRNQYDASLLIDQIKKIFNKECDRHLLIVDIDLYSPRFNFIFGLAEPHECAAIVSVYRLAENGLTQERLAKEVIHEVGHLMGLSHCKNPTCVMYFSHTVDDTDRKDMKLCPECRRKIEKL
ncbi:MAG: archaemetzincin family Zn-dependent metalloprotease [bacterium]